MLPEGYEIKRLWRHEWALYCGKRRVGRAFLWGGPTADNGPSGQIGIEIYKNHRNKKLGFELVHRIVEALRAEGCPYVAAKIHKANTPSIRLFAAMGFRPSYSTSEHTLRLVKYLQ